MREKILEGKAQADAGKLIDGAEGPEQELPPLSAAQLRQIYGMARTLLSELEYDRAAEMLDGLARYRLPDGERERWDDLRAAAERFEWEKLERLLGDALA